MGEGPPPEGERKGEEGRGKVGRGGVGREGEGLSPEQKSWLRPCKSYLGVLCSRPADRPPNLIVTQAVSVITELLGPVSENIDAHSLTHRSTLRCQSRPSTLGTQPSRKSARTGRTTLLYPEPSYSSSCSKDYIFKTVSCTPSRVTPPVVRRTISSRPCPAGARRQIAALSTFTFLPRYCAPLQTSSVAPGSADTVCLRPRPPLTLDL